MKKTIVVFSNPFGYGPTGNAIPILESLFKKTKDIDIIFAGSGLCMEIASGLPVKRVLLDERDEEQIEVFLKSLDNPFVIGSQNRFCIKVAKRLGIPCSFVDILAWFWKEIPQDHLLADEIFWINFPSIENKIPKNQNNIHVVSGIINTLEHSTKEAGRLMIHIGGAKYPYSNDVPSAYLNLMAKGLNEAGEGLDSIIFASGMDAISYLKQSVFNKKALLISLPKDKFIQELGRSEHVMTTAGVSSTLESFSLDIPTSFLLPLNLSQVALADILSERGCFDSCLKWEDYVDVDKDLRDMTEKDAISEINRYAEIIDKDEKLSRKFVKDFVGMTKTIPDRSEQTKLIKSIGESGADEIVEILTQKWSLS